MKQKGISQTTGKDINISSEPKRRRGIRASRARLESEMRKAGFKSQSALAREIARREGGNIDSPPRDMVNRVFRGVLVDHQTLERIADVFGVKAFELFMTSDEAEALEKSENSVQENLTESEVISNSAKKKTKHKIKGFVIFLVVGVVGLFIYGLSHDAQETPSVAKRLLPKLTLGVVAEDIESVQSSLKQELVSSLEPFYKVSTPKSANLLPNIAPWEVAEKLQIDAVLIMRTENIDQHQLLQFTLYHKNRKIELFSAVSSLGLLELNTPAFLEEIIKRLKLATQSPESFEPYENELKAVELQLKALDIMNGALDESVTASAVATILRSLSYENNNASVLATACLALNNLFRLNGEQQTLTEAEGYCRRSDQIEPNNPAFLYAQAFVEKSRNNLDEALAKLDNVLQVAPNYVNAAIVKADTLSDKILATGDLSYADTAITLLDRVERNSEPYWKVPFFKGRIYFFSGKPNQALIETRKAHALFKNNGTYTNLALFEFCYGETDAALKLYEEAALQPNSAPMTTFNLISVYSYFEEFEKAAQTMDKFVAMKASRNEPLGVDFLIGAGSIYFSLKNYQFSEDYFEQAYQSIETEIANHGETPPMLAKRLLVEINLRQLQNHVFTKQEKETYKSIITELEQSIVNPLNKLTLLMAIGALALDMNVADTIAQLSTSCKAYAKAPIFKRFGFID